jgi:transposase
MSQENSSNKQPLIRYVNRQQMSWRAVDVERLVDEDHLARAIWALIGRMDPGQFYQSIESNAEEGGRPSFDPQLLISLWVYAYSQGIGSAREVARRCEYDPAFQWLTGLQEVNYHTLADFRVEKQKELDELFRQVLAALSKEGLITLDQVMQDGTKIRAQASPRSVPQREAVARTSAARTARAAGKIAGRTGEAAHAESGQVSAQTGEHYGSRSAHYETTRRWIGTQLQCAAFHRCLARFNRGCARDASGERLGADCCGRGLHDARLRKEGMGPSKSAQGI